MQEYMGFCKSGRALGDPEKDYSSHLNQMIFLPIFPL